MRQLIKKPLALTALLLSIGNVYSNENCPEGVESSAGLANVLTTPQNFNCAAVLPQPLNLELFRKAANQYVGWLENNENPREFALCVLQKNPELWETLILYQRDLLSSEPADAVITEAFLHYVINKPCSKLADDETADLEPLLNSYRASLLLEKVTCSQLREHFVAQTIGPRGILEPLQEVTDRTQCNQFPWKLEDIRALGQQANMERYGRGDIVPTRLLGFTESSDGYSHLNAVWMAEMSALAYWTPDKRDNPNPLLIKKQLMKWGYTSIADIKDEKTDTSAFLAAKDNHLVLSFRGTSSWSNFVTDIKIRKTEAGRWAKGKIHAGFKNALDSVWPQIQANLKPPGQQQVKIWVTGHSLGAALAQLAALRLQASHYPVQAVYTFGTPLLGDDRFVKFYDEFSDDRYEKSLGDRTFPHINHWDPVALVPPSKLGFSVIASDQIRLFTGTGHELKNQLPDPFWRIRY